MNRTPTRLLSPTAITLFLALPIAWAVLAAAPRAAQGPAASASASVKTAPDGKKVLTLADYGPWKRIASAAISDDGKWATYTYAPNDGDSTLFVKQLDGDTLHTIPIGSAAAAGAGGAAGGGGRGGGGGGGGGVQFSDDGHWIAYFVNPPAAASRGRGAATGGATGAGGRGGGGAPPARGGTAATGGGAGAGNTGPVRRLQLLDLTTGAKSDVPNASGFQFSKGSQWLAIKMNGTPGDTSHRGTDLVLRRLATGATQNIGNVNQYDFDGQGRLLAYTVDAAGRMGNGVYVTTLATGETRALDSAAMDYDSLLWREGTTSLLALRGDKPRGKELRENALVTWADAGATQPARTDWDPAMDPSFPKGFVLSENTAPRWSKDGTRVFVGIKAQEDTPAPGEADAANVDIWHWKDVELQSEQMLRVAQARRATFAAVVTPASKQFARLADDTIPTVTPVAGDRWTIGRDATPYAADFSEGQPSRADYYRIDTTTGARTPIAKHLLRTMGTSPDGQWFLYLENQHVIAHHLETGKKVTVDAATGKSFINTDDDHAAEKSIWGVAGWTKDGNSVLLYDKYDVWSLPLDGGKGANLTGGAGAAQQMELRITRLGGGGGRGGGRGGGGGADEGIDTSQPQTLVATGEWTKKTGYWRLPAGGGTPAPIIWADKSIGGVQKAKDADRIIFTQQTFEEFPDYWVSDSSFTSPRKITDANPQIADYAWGKRVLVDFANSKGKKLQGTLTLPAGYQAGKKYPMVVYIYEILSNTHHTFSMPVYDDRPHASEYASDGYLMFSPDIVYDIGHPGTSALDCVTAGVKKVIDLGYADPQHIGLQGHSWGGYESSFIVTQTNMFAAVVTGAPLTDLISMYGEIYKQTGAWNGGILETSQGRMGANVTPWNARALYESESPLFSVTKIQTPFMILQGTSDGAVDWDQGLEFYTAARRNGKQVIFLSYPDEPHHLAKPANQKDFQVRMKQYFDHYLKGAPEPEWMKNGLPQVKKGS
jgi:dienelactone hydrolase